MSFGNAGTLTDNGFTFVIVLRLDEFSSRFSFRECSAGLLSMHLSISQTLLRWQWLLLLLLRWRWRLFGHGLLVMSHVTITAPPINEWCLCGFLLIVIFLRFHFQSEWFFRSRSLFLFFFHERRAVLTKVFHGDHCVLIFLRRQRGSFSNGFFQQLFFRRHGCIGGVQTEGIVQIIGVHGLLAIRQQITQPAVPFRMTGQTPRQTVIVITEDRIVVVKHHTVDVVVSRTTTHFGAARERVAPVHLGTMRGGTRGHVFQRTQRVAQCHASSHHGHVCSVVLCCAVCCVSVVLCSVV